MVKVVNVDLAKNVSYWLLEGISNYVKMLRLFALNMKLKITAEIHLTPVRILIFLNMTLKSVKAI